VPFLRRFLLMSASAVAMIGCAHPLIPGPQLTQVPPGFGFDGQWKADRPILPDRHIVEQRGYVQSGRKDNDNSILIMTLSGPTTYDSIVATWTALESQPGNAEYGPVISFPVGHRTAWGWRVLHRQDDRVVSQDLVGIVSDEDSGLTYVLEFRAASPEYRNDALMTRTLGSLKVKGKDRVSVAKLGAVIALAAGFAFVYTRARASLA
jgi:hypothetical protein